MIYSEFSVHEDEFYDGPCARFEAPFFQSLGVNRASDTLFLRNIKLSGCFSFAIVYMDPRCCMESFSAPKRKRLRNHFPPRSTEFLVRVAQTR